LNTTRFEAFSDGLFRLVRTLDRTTVFLNLGLLAATVFIPFATSVLGAYPGLRSAELLYGPGAEGGG
jgi:uncharacterized membrane protein